MSRRRQCEKCPWKVSTNPREIPNGYCEEKHRALQAKTIATPGELRIGRQMRVMACHESPVGADQICVGWLDNQLHEGNNIALRLAASRKLVPTDYVLDGEQHKTLEDTFPKDESERARNESPQEVLHGKTTRDDERREREGAARRVRSRRGLRD